MANHHKNIIIIMHFYRVNKFIWTKWHDQTSLLSRRLLHGLGKKNKFTVLSSPHRDAPAFSLSLECPKKERIRFTRTDEGASVQNGNFLLVLKKQVTSENLHPENIEKVKFVCNLFILPLPTKGFRLFGVCEEEELFMFQ